MKHDNLQCSYLKIKKNLDVVVCVEKLTCCLSGQSAFRRNTKTCVFAYKVPEQEDYITATPFGFGRRLWALAMAKISRSNTAQFTLGVSFNLLGCLWSFEYVLF